MQSLYHPFRNVTLNTMKLSQNGNGFWFRLDTPNVAQHENLRCFLRSLGRSQVFYSQQNYSWYIHKQYLALLAVHVPGMAERAEELLAQQRIAAASSLSDTSTMRPERQGVEGAA